MPKATLHTWTNLPTDTPMPKIERQRIIGEKAMLSRVFLHKGFFLAEHQHDNEQFVCVLSGRVRFTVEPGTPPMILTGGQVLELPANVPHSAEALEDTVILDIFSPVSQGTGVDKRP